MKSHRLLWALLVLTAVASPVTAADLVKLHSEDKTLRGRVTEMSKTQIVFEMKPVDKTIMVNDIAYIKYDEEPDALSTVRRKALQGQFAAALKQVRGIKKSNIARPEILEDIAFYEAYCASKLALGGSGTIKDAGRLLKPFIDKSRTNYHYYEAVELFGDLAVVAGGYSTAEKYYKTAAEAPWPDAKVRIGVARAHVLMAQKKYAEAKPLFDRVLASKVQGPQVEQYKITATLGKAVCDCASGNVDQAIKVVEAVIARADAKDTDLHAQAFLALGNCFRAAKRPDDARLAYLHVDVLYFQDPQIHAEALARLSNLWLVANKPDRSKEALARLRGKYPNSRWNKSP